MTTESVKVVVRCRPFVDKETKMGCKKIIDAEKNITQISISKPDDRDTIKSFRFDEVFDENSTQQQIYDEVAFSLVESVSEGYNGIQFRIHNIFKLGTVFAYGQTGCGKTHTMIGNLDDDNQKGIMPKSFSHVFSAISSENNKGKQFLIRCSFIEIYNEEIRDLLNMDQHNKRKLEIKENQDQGGVYIKDCIIKVAHCAADLEKALKDGNKNKTMGETQMNRDSSRSHCNGQQKIKMGKLNLVDLAGSEKQKKTGATGVRLKEATKINLSLSALMNVITCLVDGKSSHIPYRDSKLTRLLQDSLGGNTKTCMIANISPADYNYDETLSTLRYADRAKQIRNKPKINEDPKDALLREYAEEIKKLKEQLASINTTSVNVQQQLPEPALSQTPVLLTQQSENKPNLNTQSLNFQNQSHSATQIDNFRNSQTQKQSIHNSLSQSPHLKQGIPKMRNANDYTSSGGSFVSHPKNSQQSQLADEEFALSNSEFMTEHDYNSKSVSPINSIGGRKFVANLNRTIEQKESSSVDEQMKQRMEQELKAKQELESKLRELQEQLQMGGNQILEAQQEKMNQYREFQIRLKQQKQREKELLEVKIKQEEEMMLVEKNYHTLQEEVDDMRKLIKIFRTKYRQAVNEIKDLNTEHNRERAELFENLQDYEKENALYRELMRTLISDSELSKLVNKCDYDPDNKKWDVPLFIIKEKSVQLPKMPGGLNSNKAKADYKQQQFKQNRDINQALVIDRTTVQTQQINRVANQHSDVLVKRSLSQTNYDKWKDFSQGRKTLQDFAEAPSMKQLALISNTEQPLNLSNQNKVEKQSQSNLNSFSLPKSRDNSLESQIVAVVANKKPKKKIQLKPLIPPTNQSYQQESGSTKNINSNGDIFNHNDSSKYNFLDKSIGFVTNTSSTPTSNFAQSQYSLSSQKLPTNMKPINLKVSQKLNPIAKKNLINQLKAHLAKDSTINNLTNSNNTNNNYNIIHKTDIQQLNFNFFKTSKNESPEVNESDSQHSSKNNSKQSASFSAQRDGSNHDKSSKRKSIELNIKATLDIDEF
ncbi:kinesin motor domain containing protein [Stylonychia lemnae]|uniref:Kinesin motor domain containing protein n=1 Tax=Stylonychia lemnae TaxID=5949 RepID=A0A078B0G5_STYLE|nr:kinesin motor domain containing protein [Stylonychia lemnae]|eukprot:CDW88014.1 kinesin motor domain containing protein [Stylonychia lemnae]